MGSRNVRGRNAIARRIAAVARQMPREVDVVHTDLLPRALVERVMASVTAFAPILDGPSGACLGVAERGAAPWDEASRETLALVARALVGPSALSLVEPVAELPRVAELALFELRASGGSMRLFLDPARLVVRDEPTRLAVDLPITISIEVAETTLTRRDLRALALGDVVTLDHDHQSAPRGLVPGARRIPRFTLAGGELRFERTEDRGDTMDQEDEDALVRIDDARLVLSVELARIATTVGELSGLARGELFATGRPEAREVTLRLHGRAVARGELVMHEGELAVRIVELATGDQ